MITLQVPDEDQGVIPGIRDMVRRSEEQYVPTSSDFLNPYQRLLAKQELKDLSQDLRVRSFGGFSQGERRVISVCPDVFPEGEEFKEIVAFYGEGEEPLTHSEVLGALTGLGLDRKKIGDIVIEDRHVYFVVKRECAGFIGGFFQQAGRKQVLCRKIPLEDLPSSSPKWVESTLSVSSLRADAVVAGAYGLSRREAERKIAVGDVHINYRQEDRGVREITVPAMLSLRRHGRILVLSREGFSKKGKIRLRVGRMI